MVHKHWRALIRIESVNNENKTFTMCIPAFGWDQIVERDLSIIPEGILLKGINAGQRLYAKVNIDAEDSAELTFKEWEAR